MPIALIEGALRRDDPVLLFAAVLAIILVAPLLFERLRVPGLVGLIAAGLLLGPHGLGVFENNAAFSLLATVGLLYLMFLAGLEINLNESRQQRAESLAFGAATFAVPMLLGTFLSRLLLPGFSWVQAILLASMFASHTLLPHPIAVRLGLARHRAVAAAVGGTILTDTAALLVLAAVAELTRSRLTLLFVVRQMALLAAFVVLVLRGLPRLGYWFMRRVDPDGAAEFAFVLAAAFACALGSRLVGVEPIIGAFLAGLALSPLVPEHGVLHSRVAFAGHALFIPFFLLSVGMLIDPRVFLAGWSAWRVALFMCATVVAAKWLAAGLAGRWLRFSPHEVGLLFGLSVNQAAATLAAVLVGRDIGLFDDAVLNGTVMMILVTCVVGPWMTARHGREVARQQRVLGPPAPAGTARVLVALRSSERADALVDVGLLLRGSQGAQPLFALHVAEEGRDEEARLDASERVLTAAVVRGAAAAVPVQGVVRLAANPAAGLLQAARELRASAVVVGWSAGSPARALFFRSLLDRVIEGAHATVVACRCPQPLAATPRVVLLVPPFLDRLGGFEEGVRLAALLASRAGAALHAWTTSDTRAAVEEALQRVKPRPATQLDAVRTLAEAGGAVLNAVRPGDFLVLLSCRRGQSAWQPGLERLPVEWARRFAQQNLAVIYPGREESTGSADDPATRDDTETPPEERFPSLLAAALRQARTGVDGTVGQVVDLLLSGRVTDAAAREAAGRALHAIEPVELAPGALLLHAHPAGLAHPELLLATGRVAPPSGVPTSAPVCVVMVLLAPHDQPPETHLRLLADLARLLQRPGLVAALASAPDADALQQAVTRAASAGTPP